MSNNPQAYHESSYVCHDLEEGAQSYKLLNSIIVPRPIALITTLGPHGIVNAAPFSYFNAVCASPAIVSVSIARKGAVRKDTARNILENKEFVINICSVEMAHAVSCTSRDVPPEVSEVDLARLSLIPSTKVQVPRIANTLVQLECRLSQSITYGEDSGELVLGSVVSVHIHQELFKENGHIDLLKLNPLARLAGASYAKICDFFDVP